MSKWESNGNTIYDEYGTPLARCYDDELDPQITYQIVREHNAHEELVDMVRKYMEYLEKEERGMNDFCAFINWHEEIGLEVEDWDKNRANPYTEKIAELDAVLARAEGRE